MKSLLMAVPCLAALRFYQAPSDTNKLGSGSFDLRSVEGGAVSVRLLAEQSVTVERVCARIRVSPDQGFRRFVPM